MVPDRLASPSNDGSPRSLAGEVAIVTGGSAGIGRAVVETLASAGAAVAYCARDRPRGARVATELSDSGSVLFVPADVTHEDDIVALVASTARHFGPPTILVNNAGTNLAYDPASMTVAEWDAIFAVNLRAAWVTVKHVIPHMTSRRHGAIVNISSIHAFMTAKGYFPYGASKAAMLGLTRSMALEYATHHIRVNAIVPGFVDTDGLRTRIEQRVDPDATRRSMTAAVPLRRFGTPNEIARVARFLVSEDASYLTGASLVVDGGLTVQRTSEPWL